MKRLDKEGTWLEGSRRKVGKPTFGEAGCYPPPGNRGVGVAIQYTHGPGSLLRFFIPPGMDHFLHGDLLET